MGKITAVDLFCGAGGFSLAALNSDVTLLAAVELDADACATYKKNIIEQRSCKTKLFNEDILKVDIESFSSSLSLNDGNLDLLIGGPPCQGFSSHRINDQGVDDPRNELLIRYFDFVKKLMPDAFIVENVPGLLWERHKSYLDRFKAISEDSGYKILGPVKLNAKDYGVPQNRNRVFILGVKNSLDIDETLWPPKPTHFQSSLSSPIWRNASEVFEQPNESELNEIENILGKNVVKELKFGSELPLSADDSSAIHMNHTTDLTKRFELTPINGSRGDIDFRLPCHSDGYVGHKDVYGRIRLAQPGPTITTGCFNPSKGRFLHPWKNHGITIRHAARLQTFPDDFTFTGGITNQGKQVGNAVPVKMGEVIIKTVIQMVKGKTYTK
ncbi:DNA cytosine methyltransferase [Serratia sp. JSRIV001]|uniref:DNA cytosine methyltransferase n=1 Tax=Serratia sp. JSRIV001 TaxID=2831893 RepID=UPI001CBD82AE|nr:DNA cytosine methyltransferase [Serratia sp. JSRIV001]UAN46065.1 DNA cytosine methyltransferase [Serratia sp. JSRIV001]